MKTKAILGVQHMLPNNTFSLGTTSFRHRTNKLNNMCRYLRNFLSTKKQYCHGQSIYITSALYEHK
uniref:Uncharacterized protein n=1 Tax=Romanomermis culicivorax TaxID=13658 RepID=A0A915JGT2_ROMCU